MTAEQQDYDGHTVSVGYVHVLTSEGGPCRPDCPHPDHAEGETEPCPRCGDTSCDGKVTRRADPYLVEVHDETVMRFYCDGEFDQRKDEV